MRTMSWKKWIIGMLSILVVVFAALGFKFMPVSAEAITVDDPDDLYNTVLGASTDKKTEIQLTEDIKLNSYLWVSSGCDVTIDLNGHKLSNVTGQWVIVIADNGKLTLVDSSNGGGVITNEIQYSGCSLIYNYGTLITGVNLTVPATSTVGYTSTNDVTILSAPSSAAAAGKYAKPSVTVTGGKLQGPVQGAVINLVDSNLTVEGGTFVPNPASDGNSPSVKKIFSVSTLQINGSQQDRTIEAAKASVQADLDGYKPYRSSTVTVTGGDFTAFKSDYGDILIDPNIKVGYYIQTDDGLGLVGGATGEMIDIDTITVTLDGESAWGKDLSAYTPDGKWMELYDPSISAEKYYVVRDITEDNAGATITVGNDKKFYADFDGAWAALGKTTEDRTLTLLNDVNTEQLDFSNMSGNITLDLNGKKLTVTRSESSSRGHIDFGSQRVNLKEKEISLTVKDSKESGGEIVLDTPSDGSISTNGFIYINNYAKFTLESGTIRQTGYFPASYKEATQSDDKADEAIFHLSCPADAQDVVTIKGGNIISEIHYGTKEAPGEQTSSPYLMSWYVDTSDYELNFETGTKYNEKTKIFKFDLTDYIINNSKTSVFSWNFNDKDSGQWDALGNTFEGLTFSAYGIHYMLSNFTKSDNFLAGDGKAYETLQEAIGHTEKGSSITVLKDGLTIDAAITLDGIALDLDRNRNFTLNLGDGGSLTLKNGAKLLHGTLEGGVTVDGGATFDGVTITGDVSVAGDTTMEGATVNGNVTVTSGTLTIPSGTYENVTINSGASAYITGGYFKGSQIESLDQYFATARGAYIEAGKSYVPASMYEVKIAPNLAAQTWFNGYYNNGDGTEFQIASEAEWNAFALYVSSGVYNFQGKTVKLTADLNFKYNYENEGIAGASYGQDNEELDFFPAGNQKNPFNGTFDGNNQTITGVHVVEINAGIFGGTGGSATINSLTVSNSLFEGGKGFGYFDEFNTESGWVFVGGVVAQGNLGHSTKEAAAKNITVSGVTLSQKGRGSIMGGGFIGQTWSTLYLENITVDNVKLDGSWKMGGVVGFTEASVHIIKGTVENVESLNKDCAYFGSVMGQLVGDSLTLESTTVASPDSYLVGGADAGNADKNIEIGGVGTDIQAQGTADKTKNSLYGDHELAPKVDVPKAEEEAGDGFKVNFTEQQIPSDAYQADGVAMIHHADGSFTSYDNLQTALNEARNGETVVLMQNVENGAFTVSEGKNFTLDLNGHSITGTGNADVITIKQGATLTILGDAGSAITGYGGDYVINNEGNLTLGDKEKQHAEFAVNSEPGKASSSTVRNAGTLEIYGGTYDNNNTPALAAVKQEENGSLTIYGGTFNGQLQLVGEATISGGTFNALVFSDYQSEAMQGHVTVTDGTFTSQFQVFGEATIQGGEFQGSVYVFENSQHGDHTDMTTHSLKIEGGTFSGKVDTLHFGSWEQKYVEGSITVEPAEGNTVTFKEGATLPDARYFADEKNLPVADGSGNYVSAPADNSQVVAHIGSVGYETLQAALDVAKNGETVVLAGDITNEDITVKAGTNATLDLNGHSITGTGNADVIMVEKDATLTIIGVTGSINGFGGHYVIENHGTLNLGEEGGDHNGFTVNSSAGVGSSSTIANKTTEGATPKITIYGGTYANENEPNLAAIKSEPNTELYVKGGTFGERGNDKAGQLQIIGEAEISGGTFYSIVFSDYQTSGEEFAGGDLKITGGEFEGQVQFYGSGEIGGGTFQSIVVEAGEPNNVQPGAHKGTLTINDGTFKGQIQTEGELTINGGNFTKSEGYGIVAWRSGNLQGTVAIHGGTFSGKIIAYNTGVTVDKDAISIEPDTENGKTVTFTSADALPNPQYFTDPTDIPVSDGAGNYISGGEHTAVAHIGSVGYEKLQDAINAAKSGETVTLFADTTEDITVNFEGANFSGSEGKTLTLIINAKLTNKKGPTILVTKEGTLYLKGTGQVDSVVHRQAALYVGADSTVIVGEKAAGIALATDKLSFTRSLEAGDSDNDDGGNSYYTILNTGKLTIENAEVMKTTDGKRHVYSALIVNQKTAGHTPTLIINGGVYGDARTTVKTEPGTVTEINGGTFAGQICDMGKTTITDGEFDGIVFSYTGKAEGEKLTIEGGTFNAQVQAYSETTISGGTFKDNVFTHGDTKEADLTITGGTFAGKVYAQSEDNKLTIDPGDDGVKFTSTATLPDVKYFADEKNIPVSDGEGNYVSKSAENSKVVAHIGNVGYSTLQAALDAATVGQTVVLADDVTGPITVSNANKITLNLNGHSIIGNVKGTATITVEVGADLTIVGDIEGSQIAGSNDYYVVNNLGTLTLKGTNLVVENPEEGKTAATSSLVRNAGKLTIESGTYTSRTSAVKDSVVEGHFNAVKNESKKGETADLAELSIEGGTFDGLILAYGNTTISGGTFNYLVGGGNNQPNPEGVNTTGKLKITGGTFEAMVQSFVEVEISSESGHEPEFKKQVHLSNKGTISGGKFGTQDANGVSLVVESGIEGDVTITGGTFDKQIQTNSGLVIEGGTFGSVVAMEKESNKGKVTVKGGTYNGAIFAYSADEGHSVVDKDAVTIDPDADKTVTFTEQANVPNADYFADPTDIPVYHGGQFVSGQDAPQANDVVATVKTAEGVEYSFTSLEEALGHAVDGDTVTLQKETAQETYVIDKNITIDLNRQTLNGKLVVNAEKEVTVKDGTITGTANGYVIENNGTLTIENVTVNGGSTTSSLVVNHKGGGLTISGGSYTSDFIAIKNETGATLTISGGTFGSTGHRALLNYGTATVNGGTFEGDVASISKKGDPDGDNEGVKLTITAGTFEKGIHGYTIEYAEGAWGEAVQSEPAGVIEIAPTEENQITLTEVPYAHYFKKGYVAGEKQGDGTYKVVSGTYYAEIEGVGYATVTDALAAATEGQTVKLIRDVTEDVTVSNTNKITLDLNGYTLTGTGTAVTLYVEDSATLTVIGEDADSKIVGKAGKYTIENHGTLILGDEAGKYAGFTVDNAANGGARSSTIDNHGTLTVYGGTYKNSNTSPLAAIKSEPDGTLTIHGGTFDGQLQIAGEAAIADGTFNGIVFSDYQNLSDGGVAKGNLKITGGTFTEKVYVFGDATIENGTFGKDVYAFTDNYAGDKTEANLTVKGGTFEGNVDVMNYNGDRKPQDAEGMLTVSGGTINAAQAANLTSKDLELEKVVVLEGGKYVIKDKSEATAGSIYFGRSATEFDVKNLYSDSTNDNSRVAYRTDGGSGEWLVVTFTDFKEIAKADIEAYYNSKLASVEYEEAQKTELEEILEHAKQHIGSINYVDGVKGVQEINTHLETAKASMDAVLNKEQAGQLQTAITAAVEEVKDYATDLNANFTAEHTIVKAELDKIKAAKSQAELDVIKEAAKSAILAFHNAIESAVNEFHVYAVSKGVDLSDENHSSCDKTYSDKIRAAEDYADITTQLNTAEAHVDSHVQSDYKKSVTTRKGTAKKELIAYAASLNFKTGSDADYIDALTAGLAEIEKVDPENGGTLEQVNDALATAKENITKFYNAIENAVVLVTNYAVTNGIDASEISDEIAAIRASKKEGTQATDEGSILKNVAAAKAKVDELVADNVAAALRARKGTATTEVDALDDDYPDDAVITGAVTEAKSEITNAKDIDAVNAAVEEAKATVALQIAKLNAIKDLDEFIKDRFSKDATPAVYTSRKANIESATTVEQVNEYRGLALAELTDFHNALLAAEARVRSYATGKGLDLTKVVDDTTRGDAIHKKLWEAKATGEIEEKVTEAKGLVDGWFTTELGTAKTNAVNNFKAWAKGLNEHFDDAHKLIQDQVKTFEGVTDLTDLASRLSSAQNAVQNLFNAMKNAEEAVRLYAFINGIDPDEGTHASAIATFVDEIYQAADEQAVTDKLAEIKKAIDGYVTGDEQAAVSTAKGKVEEYLREYVETTYTPDGATYLADGTVSKLISDAATNIAGDGTIDTRAELEAAMLEVVDKIDTRIAIIKAVADLNKLATDYEHDINQSEGSLYDTYKKAIEAATTVEAVEVARAAALVAIENFHEAIERAVQDFEAYATEKGFNLEHDSDDCKTVYEAKLRAAKDYYEMDAALREAKAKIDNHVASADLTKAIEARKTSAKAELKAHAESLGLAAYGVGDPQYNSSVDPYKDGITAINAASGSVEAVNTALATARANVTAFYTAIQSAVDEVTNYATSNGIEVYRISAEIAAIRAAKKEGTQDTDEDSIKKAVADAKAKVNTLVASDVAAALDARKKSAKEEVAAMGTKYNEDPVITAARSTAEQAITAAGTIESVNEAVETAKNAIDLQVAKLDACANLDAYVSEHFLATAKPERLESDKSTIMAKESIDEVNSAYNTALAGLTSFYNSLVDAEARARSYAMTNGFDLGANVPGEEPVKTWDEYIKETVWAATKTGDAETEGTVENKVKAVQDKVDTAAGDALKTAISEAQSSFTTWAGNLNTNFKSGHETFDTQNTYIGGATSVADLATRLSNAQNAMQNLYNAMKNAEEAIRLYAFINGVDPDEGTHAADIKGLIDTIMSAADEAAVATALTAAKTAIDGYAVADEKEAVETAKKNVKTYLETYVKNTYGTTDGGKFLQDSEVSDFITGAETSIGGNGGITTAEQLETAMREVIEKIDIRIAQIEAVEELKLHADGYKFAARTENIEAYTNGKNAIEAADASIEAVNSALATAKANVTAFYNAIEAAVNEFHLYAISQGIDLTHGEHVSCDTTYSGNIRNATSDDTLAQALAAAKKHVNEHVEQSVTAAVNARKATAKAELKAHAQGLGFTINDEAIANNIDAYNTGINNIDGASTIDDVNAALATAKANITAFYNAIQNAVTDVTIYAVSNGIDVSRISDEIAAIRASKNEENAETEGSILKAVAAAKAKVDELVKSDVAAALATRKTTAAAEVDAMGTKYNEDAEIVAERTAAKDTITHASTIEAVNKAVDDAQKAIDLRVAQLDAIAEIDEYATTCGFKANSKIDAWTKGTAAIEAATDIQGVNEQRELALLAIAAFRNELLNAEGEARAYATANGIDPDSEKESGTTWSQYIKDTLWTATDSAGIKTNLSTVKGAINTAAANALSTAKNNKIEEFKTWALTVDEHFNADHALVKAQIAILNHATSVASLTVLYDQAQSTVRSVKSAMESAISEIKTYALRNGVDITDEAHKADIDKAINGIYAADNEATIRSYVDQIKEHIDKHVAEDQEAALTNMKAKAEEMLKDVVPDTYENDDKIKGLFTTGTAALNDAGIDTIEKFNAELDKQLALLAVRVAQLDAEAELKARAEELFNKRTDFVAYTSNVTKIEEATSVEAVEAELRTALLAVEDFYNAVENGVVLATNYAISHGVDVSEIATELQAIRTNAKNTNGQEDENSILHLVKAATDAVDELVKQDVQGTLNTRKDTAKTELGTYAAERFPETYTTLDAYTNGVSAIDKAGDIEAVNDALTKAMGEIDVYYNLYLDALLDLRTHAAAHGHDLDDDDHEAILTQVTNLLNEAKNAEELGDKIDAALAVLDDHIKLHDTQVKLEEYKEDMLIELYFYALGKGVDVDAEGGPVQEGAKAIRAITLGEVTGEPKDYDAAYNTAKAAVDSALADAKTAVDTQAAAQEAKKAVDDARETARHSLQVYAATKGVEWNTAWDTQLNGATANVPAVRTAADAIRNAIDEAADAAAAAADLAAKKAEAETELKLYAASKDVEWDEDWSATVNASSDTSTLEQAGEAIKKSIDAAANTAAFNAKKADAEQKLKLYAASKDVEWNNEWTTRIQGAADDEALTAAETEVKNGIDNAAQAAAATAAFAAKKADALLALKLYAATKGVAWDEDWSAAVNDATDDAALTAAKTEVTNDIDDAAAAAAEAEAAAKQAAEDLLELKLYAATKGVEWRDEWTAQFNGQNTVRAVSAVTDSIRDQIDAAAAEAEKETEDHEQEVSFAQEIVNAVSDLQIYAASKGVALDDKAVTDGVAAIRAAKTQAEVAEKLAAAKTAVDAVKTKQDADAAEQEEKEQQAAATAAAAEAFLQAKKNAEAELQVYAASKGVPLDDKAVADGIAAIEAAKNTEEIGTALKTAKESMDTVGAAITAEAQSDVNGTLIPFIVMISVMVAASAALLVVMVVITKKKPSAPAPAAPTSNGAAVEAAPASEPAEKPAPAAFPAPAAEVKPEVEPEATAEPETKPEAKPEATEEAEVKPEPEATAEPEAEPEADPEATAEPEAEAKPEAEPEATAETKPEAEPETKPAEESAPETASDPSSES